MISPFKVKWLGETSLDKDMWTGVSFDSDNGDTDTHLGREAVVSEVYDGTLKRVHGYKWNNDYVVTLTFIKQDYSNVTPEENRRMLKWLTKNRNASFLDVYEGDSEVVAYSVLGNFTTVSQYKLANGRIVGYVCEFSSVAPYAFSDLQTKTIDGTTSEPIQLKICTDEPESCICPRITIKQDNVTSVVEVSHTMTEQDEWLDNTVYHYGGIYYWADAEGVRHTSTTNDSGFETTSVAISNTYTDGNGDKKTTKTKIINNIKDETVVLDGANKVVSSSRTNGRIFGDDFNWQWLPLFDGENTISVVGNCTTTFEYREIRKVGEF